MNCILSLVFLLFISEIECKNARNRGEFKNKLKNALKDNDIEFNPDDKDIDEYCNFVEEHHSSKLDKYDADNNSELKQRFKIFKQTKEKIKIWNENAEIKLIDDDVFYEHYGITQFADMTNDEISAMFTQEPLEPERRKLQTIQQCVQAASDKYDNADIYDPSTTIRVGQGFCGLLAEDQGQTSACWEFATAIQAQCNINFELLGPSHPDLILFNKQFISDCTTPSQGTKMGGGWEYEAVQYMSTMGFCKKDDYPYHWDTDINRDLDGHCDCNGPKYYSKCEWFDYQKDSTKLLKAAASYAWTFNMYVSDQLLSLKGDPNAPPDWKVTLFSCTPKIYPDGKKGGHAMTIVTNYWDQFIIIKNSWGSDWGYGGLAYIAAGALTGDCHKDSILSRSYEFTTTPPTSRRLLNFA